MQLEQNIFYKVKLPLFSSYKPYEDGYQGGILSMLAQLERLGTTGPYTPEQMAAQFSGNAGFERWYAANADALRRVREKALTLKRTGDTYVFNDAIFYTLGLAAKAVTENPNFSHYVFALASCCLDLAGEEFSQLHGKFDGSCFDMFGKYIPQTLSIWPRIRKKSDITAQEKVVYDEKAIALFDYILERAAFSIETTDDSAYKAYLIKQLLCYYKWLVNNQIYLPQQMQKRLYDLSR